MASSVLDDVGMFLPPPAQKILKKAFDMLESKDLKVDEFLRMMLSIGEGVIEQGLDFTVDGLESLVGKVYKAGIMEKLGDINPFIRDGAEIGIQIGLNTLKAMTASDVAKVIGLIVVAVALPNLFVTNGAEFMGLVAELAMKLWNLP